MGSACSSICGTSAAKDDRREAHLKQPLTNHGPNKPKPFPVTKHEVETEAFPECQDADYMKAHPYLKVLPFTAPSIEFRQFYDTMHSKKLQLLSGRFPKPKSVKAIVDQKRVFLKRIDEICGKASPAYNTIIDNIYLTDQNIRFCVFSYDGASAENGIILYVHGGSYLGGSHTFPLPMLSKLSQATGCIAVSIDYRVPPEFPLPVAVEDTLTLYQWLIDHDKVRSDKTMRISDNCPDFLLNLPCDGSMNRKIAICGDSAGGCTTLLTLQRIKQSGTRMPCCSWVLSPKTFIKTLDKDEKVRNEVRDCWLTTGSLGKTWAHLVVGNYKDWKVSDELKPEEEWKDPELGMYSPLNGDVKGLCPLRMSCGATELVLDDTLLFSEKVYKAGGDIEVEIEPFLCHPYPIFVNVFPEAVYATLRGAEFIKKHLEKANKANAN